MKAFVFIFIFTAIFSQASFSQKITVPLPITQRNVKPNDTVAYAIIKYDKQRDRYIFKKAKAATLNRQEIIEIEKLTSKAVSEYNKHETNDHLRIHNLLSYYRQYVAIINSHGEKEVWVNCFCAARGDEWRTEIFRFDDGGSCFFQFTINLKRKKYHMFGTNGLA